MRIRTSIFLFPLVTLSLFLAASSSFAQSPYWYCATWTPSSGCGQVQQSCTNWDCRHNGQLVPSSVCVNIPKPSGTRIITLTNACSYQWVTGSFGSCTGTGDWLTSEWSPLNGCGPTPQERTATCAIEGGSGTRTRSVYCRRSDGVTVADSYCNAATKPATSEACSLSPEQACGPQPATSRIVDLDTDCGCKPDPENSRFCLYVPI